MNRVTLDFETFFSSEFGLTKLSFIEYINDSRFETLSCSIKINGGETEFLFGEEAVGSRLKSIDWSTHAAVAHNGNEFDFPLLVWRYDCHPKLFIDTLAIARAKNQSARSMALAALAEHHGLRKKEEDILHKVVKGKRAAELDMREIALLQRYNNGDTDNADALFRIYVQPDTADISDLRDITATALWHKKELLLSDLTARAACYPAFELDQDLVSSTLDTVNRERAAVIADVADRFGYIDEDDLRSDVASASKFRALLNSLNVAVPTKTSKATGKPIPALAKTDPGMQSLLNHPNDLVRMLAELRLSEKSVLLPTRLSGMLRCAAVMDAKMPVPLAYHSATTGRWGGRVWNPQNLPRISRDKSGAIIYKHSNALRRGLRAPKGYKVVVSDLSGIELRVNHYLWNVTSSMELYAADPEADLYREFAAFMYNTTPDKVTKDQRQLAKVAQLGLGFGAGAKTFQTVAKTMGGIDLAIDQAMEVVSAWRTKYNAIVRGWEKCNRAIVAAAHGYEYRFGGPSGDLLTTYKDKVRLPSGRFLYYPDLRKEIDDDGKPQTKYGQGRGTSKIYGGLADENFVQAIARDVIAGMALEVRVSTGRVPALMVHDELVYVVEEDQAESFLNTLNSTMRTPPAWLPGIVLWSEGDIADTYGDAK